MDLEAFVVGMGLAVLLAGVVFLCDSCVFGGGQEVAVCSPPPRVQNP